MAFAKRHSPTAYQMFTYTAVGAETSFTGADDNGNTLSYDPATVVCYIDGVKLLAADYTATDGSSVTGIAAMTAGQTFECEAIGDSGNPIVSYTKAASDAKYPLISNNLSDMTAATMRTNVGIPNHDSIVITSSGEAVNAEQPIVLAVPASSAANITGDGTTYTIVWGTEIYDIGANFSSTTFTAPVTGKYHVDLSFRMIGVVSGHTQANLDIVASNRTVRAFEYGDVYSVAGAAGVLFMSGSVDVDMDAADTITTTIRVEGGTKVVDGGDDVASGTFLSIRLAT
jgi:hypothetical protein